MPGYALSISFWQRLQDFDSSLFLFLNHQFANPVFDVILPFFRDSLFWTPLYLFILAFVFLNLGGTKGFWWTLCFLATVALADLTGTYGFKETVQRIRPCNEPALAGQVRLLLARCPGGYSFLSNHAANHFGLATFMVCTFKGNFKHWIYLFYVWAFLISFAQLYVGVHYPSDIIAGCMLGLLAGFLTAWIYRRYFGKPEPVM